jgi:hypothetical protein
MACRSDKPGSGSAYIDTLVPARRSISDEVAAPPYRGGMP